MRLASAAVAAALAVSVAACGGGASSNGIEKKSGSDALAQVRKDVKTVDSVHVSGNIAMNGKTLTMDVDAGHGEGQGTLSSGGGTLEVRLLDNVAYVKGDEQAYTAFGAPAAQVKLLAGKWLKSPTSSSGGFGGFTQFLDVDSLFNSLLTPEGTVKTGDTTTIDGQKALELIDSVNGGTSGGSLYVSETGKALPLRVKKTGSDGGQVDFSHYDDKLSVTAPSGAVDISTLG